VEGRPVSDSEEENGEADGAAVAAAVREAEMEGATVDRMEGSRDAGKGCNSIYNALKLICDTER
jgi:hypothetical protein